MKSVGANYCLFVMKDRTRWRNAERERELEIRIARRATFVDVVGGVLGEVLGRCRDKHALLSSSLVTDKRTNERKSGSLTFPFVK